MVISPSDIALSALREERAYFVDEDGNRLVGSPEEQLLLGSCWAHLQDSASGQWFVHPLRQAAEIKHPRMLDMLLPLPSISGRVSS